MMLYKYYAPPPNSRYSIDNLKANLLCFSEIDAFNDPCEGGGKFIDSVTEDEKIYWETIGVDLPKALCERFGEESRLFLKFYNRICCVTERYDNSLMWAHYASSHRGFCVGYRYEDINAISTSLQKVQYGNALPVAELADPDCAKVEDFLYHKSANWSYEEEWRAIYRLENKDIEHLDYFSNFSLCFTESGESNSKLYLPHGHINFNNLEVLSAKKHILMPCKPRVVYIGVKSNENLREEIVTICEEKSIPAYQMVLDKSTYNMRAVEIRRDRV